MNADRLLAHFNTLVDTPGAVPRLRRFILDLAVRGKLVPQDPNDELASELLGRITKQRARMIDQGVIRKPRESLDRERLAAPFDIPSSWRWVRLRTVGAIVGGGTPAANDTNNFADPGTGFPWLTPADLGRQRTLFIARGARDLTEQGLQRSSATRIPAGSVLFTSRAPVGYVAIALNPVSTNQGFKSIVPYIDECSRFIAVVLMAFAPEIDANAPGTTFREVSGKIISQHPFPLPPLAEQHRIVAKVDELMNLCDRLKDARQKREAARDRFAATNLVRLSSPDPDLPTFRAHARFAISNLNRLTARSDQISTLRRTILDLAVRGKLVPQSASEGDGESLLSEIRNARSQWTHDRLRHRKGKLHGKAEYQRPPDLDVPSNWAVVRLGQAVDLINGRAFKPSDWTQSGLPIVRIQNLNNPAAKFNRYDGDVRSRFLIDNGDFLISWSGSFGAYIWAGGQAILNQHIFKAVLIADVFEPKFLKLAINSRTTDLIEQAHGVSLQHITKPKLQAISLALPPLAEQRRVVARLDEMMTVCDRLAARLATSEDTRCSMLDAVLHEVLERDARTGAAAPVAVNVTRSG